MIGIGRFAFGMPSQHRHAIRVGCGFGKRIIADSLKKGQLDNGYISALDRDGRTIFVGDVHRDDGKRFVVRAEEKLTAFIDLESAIRRAIATTTG